MAGNDNPLGLRARARLGSTLRGKYKLQSILGVGGMAVVYRAEHRNRAEFAVKMLLPDLASDPEIRTRFLREGYVANSVKHPGVVSIVDDDVTEDGAAFLVMELLHGMSCDELCERRGGRVPVQIALTIGWHLLDVLAAAHVAGIVHRDIKPANVFVTRDGGVKVLDFGIARLRDASAHAATATQSGVSFGTPAFMAPEQAQGKTREVDERTDIWAATATMFMLITGALVHTGENATMLMVAAATQPPRPITQLMPNFPPQLAAVIDAGLRFDKNERWQTAAQMRDALLAAYATCFGEQPSPTALAAYCQTTPEARKSSYDQATKAPGERDDDEVTTAEGNNAPGLTAKPVSSDSDKRAASRRSRWLTYAVAGSMAALIAVLSVYLLSTRTGSTPNIGALPPPSVSTVTSAARPAGSTTPTLPALPSVAPSVAIPTIDLTRPAASASSTIVRPRPSTSVKPPTTTNKPACNPPFTIDADGNKHFKPECYPQQ